MWCSRMWCCCFSAPELSSVISWLVNWDLSLRFCFAICFVITVSICFSAFTHWLMRPPSERYLTAFSVICRLEPSLPTLPHVWLEASPPSSLDPLPSLASRYAIKMCWDVYTHCILSFRRLCRSIKDRCLWFCLRSLLQLLTGIHRLSCSQKLCRQSK